MKKKNTEKVFQKFQKCLLKRRTFENIFYKNYGESAYKNHGESAYK